MIVFQYLASLVLLNKHFLIPAAYSCTSSKWYAAMQLQKEGSPLNFLVGFSTSLSFLARACVGGNRCRCSL